MIAKRKTRRPRRASLTTALVTVAALVAAALGAPAAQAAPEDYDFESVSAARSADQAGAHPDLTTELELTTDGGGALFARTKDLGVDLPPGFVGNPDAVVKCEAADFSFRTCPVGSQLGTAVLDLTTFPLPFASGIYNLEPPNDRAARIGLLAFGLPTMLDISVRSDDDYGVTVGIEDGNSQSGIVSIDATIWGVPGDPSHNAERITPLESLFCATFVGFFGPCPYAPIICESPVFALFAGEFGLDPGVCPGEPRSSGLPPLPFVSNPTSCGPLQVGFTTSSYQLPDLLRKEAAPLPETAGCEKVPFEPSFSLSPTSRSAASPSGIDVSLSLPQSGLVNPDGLASAHLKRAVVTLPEGVSLNPASADGLGSCAEEQIGLIPGSDPPRFDKSEPSCPDSSKVGTVEIETPVLEDPLEGSLYVAEQNENPFGSLLAGYLVAEGHGLIVKLAGEFDLDPRTGQLVASFDNNPQQPFSKLDLHIKGGARGVIATPEECGVYETNYELTPWSGNAPVTGVSNFTIDQGCDGGGFAPGFEAGVANPFAGRYSPFAANITRRDGEENLAAIRIDLPRGLTAKLAGIPLCPDSLAPSGDCPAASRIGKVDAAVGVGTTPLWIPQAGKEPTAIYLAGPYGGAPYSAIVKTPAQAGPFDFGTVTVRAGIHVDRRTGQVSVQSDSLPQILQGVLLDYRDVNVNVDREGFALNSTSCSAMRVGSRITSDRGSEAVPFSPFRVGGCGDLGFKPRTFLRLFGKRFTRGANPGLRAIVMPREGDANIGRSAVLMPRSIILDQANIRTVCTRVQFAANACPAASIYGHAVATTPLLDQPLRGPVYLRSSDNKLPDLVADIRGQVALELVGRIDSVRGGIRTVFEEPPDAPVSKFVLKMQRGKKSLLVASRDLCAGAQRARVAMRGHNGRTDVSHPRLNIPPCRTRRATDSERREAP